MSSFVFESIKSHKVYFITAFVATTCLSHRPPFVLAQV